MSVMKVSLQLVVCAVVALCAQTAAAQARPDDGPAIDVVGAKKPAAAAIDECTKNKWNVAVAIVDTQGFPVLFDA